MLRYITTSVEIIHVQYRTVEYVETGPSHIYTRTDNVQFLLRRLSVEKISVITGLAFHSEKSLRHSHATASKQQSPVKPRYYISGLAWPSLYIYIYFSLLLYK